MSTVEELEARIVQLSDQVAGYAGSQRQLQAQVKAAQDEAADYKAAATSLGQQIKSITDRLPALEAQAKRATRLESLADTAPELMSNKDLRELALSSNLSDDTLAVLLGNIAANLGDMLTADETAPEVTAPAPDAPAVTTETVAPPVAEAETAPIKPTPPQTPPPTGGHKSVMRTTEAIRAELRKARESGDTGMVERLSLELFSVAKPTGG
jgi:hypothetical protein